MAKIVIEDAEMHTKKKVDSEGRVYLGSDFSGQEVRITVETLNNED